MLNNIKNIVGSLGCHQMPERSFFINGKQLPVCARCTGVLIGQLLTIFLALLKIDLPITICLVFILLMFCDWFFQYKFIIESNNIRRLATGILGGSGLTVFYIIIAKKIFCLFVN